jgi:outer membrane protein TolC
MRKYLLILTFLLPFVLSAAPEPVGAQLDTLGDYLDYALTHNLELKVMEARVDAAKSRVPQAGALPDPMFQVTHFGESVQTRTGPQENIFMLSQKFPWFGVLDGRADAAAADARAVAFAYWNRQLVVVRDVARAFFEYAYIGKAIALTEENASLLRKLEPIVETRVQGGEGLNQMLRLRVEIGKLEDKLASLKQKRIAQSGKLNAMLNLPAGSLRPWPDWDVPDPVPLDEQALTSTLPEQHPDLRRLDQAIAAEKARVKVARRSSYPDFVVGVNYIQVDAPDVMTDTPGAGDDPWAVTAAVSIPLWTGKYRGQRQEALARARAAEAEKIDRAAILAGELNASIAMYADANRRLRLYGGELLGLAEQALENSRTSYESGGVSILDLIDSERSLLDLQLTYWRAAADAWQERIAIQTLVDADPESILNKQNEEVAR